MESIKKMELTFVSVSYGYGYGNGSGSGSGNGSGDGSGYGNGSGSGYGDGYGDGSGYGNGYGDGSGYGNGSGDGSGYGNGDGNGSGSGYGDGNGSGDGKKSINGTNIYIIDGIPTILSKIRGNIARGKMFNKDLTFTDCYIVKHGNLFAHGETLHEAFQSLQEKAFEDLDEDERIDLFVKNFPQIDDTVLNKDLFSWHNKLTGSCLMGRNQFVKNHGIDLDESMSVSEFIELTSNDYQGHIIKKLKERYVGKQ